MLFKSSENLDPRTHFLPSLRHFQQTSKCFSPIFSAKDYSFLRVYFCPPITIGSGDMAYYVSIIAKFDIQRTKLHLPLAQPKLSKSGQTLDILKVFQSYDFDASITIGSGDMAEYASIVSKLAFSKTKLHPPLVQPRIFKI